MLSILTLRNEKTHEYYDILTKKTHLVARVGFNGDLEISSDLSVSRCHAEISVVKQVINSSEIKISLRVVDKKSKFGTFVNDGIDQNKPIESNINVFLKLGDRIRFGALDSIWTVQKYTIVACPSTLKMVDKEILKKFVTKLEGKIERNWSERCTHLCMNTVTVTEKVLLSLASAKSIVTLKYFVDLCETLSHSSFMELPFCVDYKPNLVESILNPYSVSLDVNNERKKLFFGKTFICSTEEQLNRISTIVKTSSGKIKKYFDNDLCVDDILNNEGYIVMQQDQYNIKNEKMYQLILEKLKSVNKKPIPENDIGLAIIFASTEKHCNPCYNVSLVNLQSQTDKIESQTSAILALETEVLTINSSEVCSSNVIPDSVSETQDSVKRQLEVIMDSEEIETPKKYILLSNNKDENHYMNMKVECNIESYRRVVQPILSTRINIFETLESKKTVVNNTSINTDSCMTTVPCSQEIYQKKDYSTSLQSTISDNMNCNSNLNLETLESLDTKTTTKRKLSSVCSTFEDEDVDPFNYMDVDEIEERLKKKPKKEHESFFSSLATKSNNGNNKSNSKNSKANEVVDPNFVINLLATATSTGKFIDASKPFDKSIKNECNDSDDDYLLNSVIIETISMVVSKPIQTQNSYQGSNSNLKNFKKFKRKGPSMRIPHIVPLELSQID